MKIHKESPSWHVSGFLTVNNVWGLRELASQVVHTVLHINV